MSTSTILGLPYIAAAQAQKHVTHNEAIRALDAIVHLAVADRDLAAPPLSPTEGDRYIVAASPTGDWAGKAGQIAAYQDGGWLFYPPQTGWRAWVADEAQLVVFDGAAWAPYAGGSGSVNPVPLVGVNATADTANRLAVASPAALFTHAGAGHQIKVNKAASGDTASVLFQKGFSGRAEFGLAGTDDWSVKVSADGAAWNDVLVAERATGRVRFPKTNMLAGGRANLLINGDFQINQREFAGGGLAAGAYGFDRWKAATGGADLSRSGYVVTLASGEIEQVIEPTAWGLASLASQTVTVSVETPTNDLTVTLGSASAGVSAGTGWQSATVTLGAGDTGNLAFRLKRTNAGSTTFNRVRLELGVGPSDWMPIDGVAELALARRYFERFPPGTWGSTFHPSTVAAYGGLLFVEKRTAAWTLAHAGTIRIRDRASSSSSPLVDTFSLFDKTPRSVFFVANTTGLITTSGGLLQIFPGGYIDINAEI